MTGTVDCGFSTTGTPITDGTAPPRPSSVPESFLSITCLSIEERVELTLLEIPPTKLYNQSWI